MRYGVRRYTLLIMGTRLLETYRESKKKIYIYRELCIKLVIFRIRKDCGYSKMRDGGRHQHHARYSVLKLCAILNGQTLQKFILQRLFL